MNSKIILNLRKLGFTENEAKAYVGLLFLKEASAREIHELTNVPRPKIYGVLDRLVKKGYVEIRGGIEDKPTLFRGIAPDELARKLREEYLLSLNETLKELDSMSLGLDNSCYF